MFGLENLLNSVITVQWIILAERLEDKNTKRNVDIGGPVYVVSLGGNKKSIINMARSNSCVILAHNSPVFWPCPENFNDIKFKDARLICFLGEYSRQESIQFGAEKSALAIREISITDKKSLVLCFNYRKDVLQANPHPLEVPFGKNRD